MSYEGLYDFLLFCFNVDFNFRLHRVIGNHQQTQMTALLAYILLHYRYPQAGAFTGLQYTLLEVNSHCRGIPGVCLSVKENARYW